MVATVATAVRGRSQTQAPREATEAMVETAVSEEEEATVEVVVREA